MSCCIGIAGLSFNKKDKNNHNPGDVDDDVYIKLIPRKTNIKEDDHNPGITINNVSF